MRTELWPLVSCRRAALAGRALALFAALTAGGASAGDDQDLEDFFGGYTHRVEGVTVGAGDAAASNIASQIINPWPVYSRDRHILSESPRMIGAIERYHANSGAKPSSAQTMTQSRDAAESGASADATPAPNMVTAPSADASTQE